MIKAILYFDGGTFPLNPGHGGAGAALVFDNGEELSFSKYLGEQITNNQAEYNGLLLGLRKALELEITHLKVFGDSQLVIYQVEGIYECRNSSLYPLWQEARSLINKFESISLCWIPREKNALADAAASNAIRDLVPQAVISMPDDLPVCQPRVDLEDAIAELNAQGERASFKSLLQLKSGSDRFSKLRGEKLTSQVPDTVKNALWAALTEKEKSEGLFEKCMRWWLRGLKASCALKKVRVEAEVASKFARTREDGTAPSHGASRNSRTSSGACAPVEDRSIRPFAEASTGSVRCPPSIFVVGAVLGRYSLLVPMIFFYFA